MYLKDQSVHYMLQVCHNLKFVAVRDGAMSVLTQMLLGFQHSPEPFHKVVIEDAVDLKTT